MTGPNKILTVSYGTFSCTLEGFDDPFGTMRAIAEYFRDLAADDRYFGAEPPTPDAAMLHRIAEREMQRRVEARVQDGGVILRASDAGKAAPQAEARFVPQAAPSVRPAAAAPAEPPPQPRAEAPAAAAAPAPSPSIEDSIAAKLARIRAAVDRSRGDRVGFESIEDAEIAEAPAEADGQDAAEAAEPPAPAHSDAVAAADIPHAEPQADPAGEPAEDLRADAPVEAAVADEPADLERVEATEAGQDGSEAGDAEVEDAAGVAPKAVEAAQAGDDDSAALPAVAGAADAPLPQAVAEDEVEDQPKPPAESAPALTGADDATLAALLDTLMGGATEPDPAPQPAPAGTAETPAPEARQPDAADDAADDADAETADHDAEPAPAPRVLPGRVIRVRRVVPQPAANASAPADDGAEAADVAAALSAEAEAELARELAEVEREMAAAAPAAPPAPPPAAQPETGRNALGAEATDDAAVTRLMRQTTAEMEGPDTRRRAATIAHLKAAVAATVADRQSGAEPRSTETARAEPYREDLAKAVRPRRPEAVPGSGNRRRPEPGLRVPPLVLVSEQRIDRPARPAAEAAPVRPRRVTTGSLALTHDLDREDDDAPALAPDAAGNLFEPDQRFADFARALGVSHLPDLIEVAGAYALEVERRDSFTRPHLLRLAGGLSDSPDTAREDGLRAFGTLLREGRICKARRGQFTLSAASPLLAAARRQPRATQAGQGG